MWRDYDEKRDFRRMALDTRIQCKDLASGETFYGHAHDLSGEGLSIDTAREFAPGARLEVRIVPEKALVPPFYAAVEVVRVEPAADGGGFNLGVRILEHKS
ncbi:PilZ domain-containing protein [Thiohalobacter thiocyanaticus]|nr:PilZ domain-containing protein [Thiohalobacter thiocyanaticus]